MFASYAKHCLLARVGSPVLLKPSARRMLLLEHYGCTLASCGSTHAGIEVEHKAAMRNFCTVKTSLFAFLFQAVVLCATCGLPGTDSDTNNGTNSDTTHGPGKVLQMDSTTTTTYYKMLDSQHEASTAGKVWDEPPQQSSAVDSATTSCGIPVPSGPSEAEPETAVRKSKRALFLELADKLLSGTSHIVPPSVDEPDQPVDIRVAMTVKDILKLDMRAQTISLKAWVEVSWQSSWASWDADVYPFKHVFFTGKQGVAALARYLQLAATF